MIYITWRSAFRDTQFEAIALVIRAGLINLNLFNEYCLLKSVSVMI